MKDIIKMSVDRLRWEWRRLPHDARIRGMRKFRFSISLWAFRCELKSTQLDDGNEANLFAKDLYIIYTFSFKYIYIHWIAVQQVASFGSCHITSAKKYVANFSNYFE
jgi:hypothetical protein